MKQFGNMQQQRMGYAANMAMQQQQMQQQYRTPGGQGVQDMYMQRGPQQQFIGNQDLMMQYEDEYYDDEIDDEEAYQQAL